MCKIYTVVIIGFAHMHVNDVASYFFHNGRTRIVACADTKSLPGELAVKPYTRKWNLRNVVENFNICKVYDSYTEMLDAEKPDMAIVTSENCFHAEIVAECAMRGVSTVIEKPMAASLSDGKRMVDIAKFYKTNLLINWPTVWQPEFQLMKKLLDDGYVGKIIEIKCRYGHTGPLGPGAVHKRVNETLNSMTNEEKAATWWYKEEYGGGSMIDYCCYGTMICLWFTSKMPVAVTGFKGNFASEWCNCDDNAVMLLKYSDMFAVVESSWTMTHYAEPFGPIIYGEKGVMFFEKIEGKYCVKTILSSGKVEIHIPEECPPDMADTIVDIFDNGKITQEIMGPEFNLKVLAILDAGLRSSRTGKFEQIDVI